MQDNCESACELLEELGMKSEWVLSGQEAVDRVVQMHEKDEDFFAVILDWKMPGMDGVATTREIRRRVGLDVPIIIFSAYDWADIEYEARAAGADYFISKPLFKSKLAYLFKTITRSGGKGSGSAESHTSETVDDPLKAIKGNEFKGKHVLLAEDNDINAEIAEEILGMAGIITDRAQDGREALDMFAASKKGYYSLIFMDIQMPVMNGYEATRAIRALDRRDSKGIPIIAMTANAFAEDVQAAKSVGMNEHIAKPLDIGQLAQVLKKWL